MITRLDNKKPMVAVNIHAVFQASYAVEAVLLSAVDFPPLKRTISEFSNSETEFYGYQERDKIAAIIEIESTKAITDINSLVVHPNYFRQGIGRRLVQYVLDENDSEKFVVETGLANEPAIKLYGSFGFKETMQWDTDHGVRKVKFELKTSS